MSKGTPARLLLVLPIAAIVTLGLFLGMSGILESDYNPTAKPPPIPEIVMADRNKPEPPEAIDSKPPADLPPPPKEPLTDNRKDTTSVVAIDNQAPKPIIDETSIILPSLNTAIIRVEPIYPQKCLSRDITGSVIVIFDVTAAGNVVNERVQSSSNNCLDRAALNAIRKWKFSPTNGNPENVVKSGLRKRFTFEISD